ncbi:cellulose synthase-like protein H1 isoform X2 [Ipomoea triloba]|uniref:cellulose synthase-like protein H1 isoform X2 n=1 Tax=Ipomoea triloba TaxID=35885 RepID=UPI00125D46DE|nr:cellulose synthase-like protein H1 isoform X2 [Ipomoea triloba]
MAAKHPPFPLYEIKFRNNKISRAIEIIILFLLLSLITYRLFSLHTHDRIPWLLALICEAWFTFVWILILNAKWNQIQTKTYPQRLSQWLGDGTSEFPAVDMFVTTADPELEPPIITVNTVLSLLAVDYPAKKLACYVSDDGASPLTFYSLVQASNFAKLWVPFCKKYNVAVRAPFQYFKANPIFPQDSSLDFQHEWKKMKDEYSKLCRKIEEASEESVSHELMDEFSVFANIDQRDHPVIIKVIWENKGSVDNGDGVPHLIYISREKRPMHPHHFKAGAINALTRVSGVMTNAPFMLNVDCDFYVNDSKVVLHAMCFFLGVKDEKDVGFVQFPQSFDGGLKNDPYGNQLKILMEYVLRGIAGIQGSFYMGTGCFHRRKIIYGMWPHVVDSNGKSTDKDQLELFGKSKIFSLSTIQILSGSLYPEIPIFPNSLEAAKEVASCGYESGTAWGQKVGWLYGSAAEDTKTGISIHGKGWKSAYCDPNPPGFLGSAPTSGPAALTQQKRWATGLLEILICKKSPIIWALFGRLHFRQFLAYLWILSWPIRPFFEICYALLPAYCIINNSHFQPKIKEGAIIIAASIFIIYNLYTLSEYIRAGESLRAWWNNQRMWKVYASGSWLLGFLSGVVKVFGLSETVFEVTKKDHSSDETLDKDDDSNVGRFTFDESPLFVPGTTILLVNMAALFIGILDYFKQINKSRSWSLGEAICSVWVMLMYWAFLKGLFGKGKYGIPLSTIAKSVGLALLFVHACKRTNLSA